MFEAGPRTIALDTRAADRRRLPPPRRRSSSTPTRAPTPATGRWTSTAARFGSCRCASARSRSACWPPPAGPSRPGTLDALAGVVAIAIERAQFLEERKAAELTRQSEELKTALLASLGHDLRTPLTAIRVAASNLQAPWLTADERREQSDLILAEVERLTRLFQNILEMARIDAGAIATESRWAHPVRDHRGRARPGRARAAPAHASTCSVDPDVPVRLDPRLTATALAHLLENAAQYSPPGSTDRRRRASVTDDGLTIAVRDHGPGIAPADLPHLFERFYRGDAAKARASGTGHGPVDRARPAGGRARPDLGGELPGRRRAVHDRGARRGEGAEPAASPTS